MTLIVNVSACVFSQAGAEYDQAQVTCSRVGWPGFCYSWCSLFDCPYLGFRTLQTRTRACGR